MADDEDVKLGCIGIIFVILLAPLWVPMALVLFILVFIFAVFALGFFAFVLIFCFCIGIFKAIFER